MSLKTHLSKGSVLIALLAVFVSSGALQNSVEAQKPGADTQLKCEATSGEYKECEPPTTDEATAERFVLAQVRAGRTVKLSGATKNKLRGCFIRDLLIKGVATPEVGIMIDGATIEGPVDIRNGNVAYHVELTHCKFLSDVNLKRSHFLKGLSFAGSQFGMSLYGPGRLDTESATIDDDLVLDECIFTNCFTFFKSMQVGVDWSLRRATFLGDADFTGINVGGNFLADKENESDPPTQFHGVADFEAAKVGVNGGFSNVVFDESVIFSGAAFNSLSIRGASFNGDVNFRGAKISDFYLSASPDTHPGDRFKKSLTIEDMTFQYMSPEDWNALQGFLAKSNDQPNQSTYSAQFYSNLEAQFRRHGHPDQADEIYIAGLERERKGLSWYRRAFSWFEDFSIGYGRHLERLLFPWSLLFLLTGCAVFWDEANMETKKPGDAAHYKGTYKPFWYTLDLFLPIIRLGEAEVWTPTQRWRIRWKYVHTIVGNLFVPIGLAALTGIIR